MLNNEPDLDNEGYAINKFSDKVNEIISPQLTRNNSTSYLDISKPKEKENKKNKDCSLYFNQETIEPENTLIIISPKEIQNLNDNQLKIKKSNNQDENKANYEKISNAEEKNNDMIKFLLSILNEEVEIKLLNKFLQITEIQTLHKNERIEVSPKSIYAIYNGDLTIQTEFTIKQIPKILSKNVSIISKNITYSLVSIENPHFFSFPKMNSPLFLKSKKTTILLVFPKSNFFYLCEEKYSLYTQIKVRLAEFNRLIEEKYCECSKNFKEKRKNMNSIDLFQMGENKSGVSVKKKGKKRNVVRASVPNLYKKCKIIQDILGKSKSKDFLFNHINFALDNKNVERKKEVKVLQIPSKNGISFRAREVDSTNLADLKQNFFPLSFNQIVFKNKKKLIPSELFTIKDADPFKWGKEMCLFQNEERNCLNRLYTRKLSKSRNQSSFISELNSVNYHVELEKNSNFSSEKISDTINNRRFSHEKSNDVNNNKILFDENSNKKLLLPKIIEMNRVNAKKKEKLKKSSDSRNGEEDENDLFTHRIYERKLEEFGKCGGYLVQKIKRSK